MVLETLDIIVVLANQRREKERVDRLLPHLVQRGLPPQKILVCGPTWGDELTSEQIFQVYDPFCRKDIPIFTFKARCLSKGEISLVLNFIVGAQECVKRHVKTALFLESDVFLREDFVPRMEDVLKQLSTRQWDYVSLGEGARTRPPGCDPSMFSPVKLYTPPHNFVYRCTDSMLFHGDYLRKLLTTMIPFRECLDWELNIQHMVHKSTSLWVDPPLVEQGTSCGRLTTHLTS